MRTTKKELIDSFQSFDDHLLQILGDVAMARKYLDIAIEEYNEDQDKPALLSAFHNVMKAQIGAVANNIFLVQAKPTKGKKA